MSRPRPIPALVAALAIGSTLAAAAVAAVRVYDNDFSSRAEYREVGKSQGTERCDRSYREKSNAMRVAVRSGPTTCSYRPPVQGDSELPDHDVRLDAKILKSTEKSVRGGAFAELSVRSGGGGVGYSLRVFPHKQRFELARGPGGGGDFPVEGKSPQIKPVNKRNELRLVAAGADVRALVNGEEVARVSDQSPGQVGGRKIRFGVGSEKDSGKDVVAVIKQISVAIPGL